MENIDRRMWDEPCLNVEYKIQHFPDSQKRTNSEHNSRMVIYWIFSLDWALGQILIVVKCKKSNHSNIHIVCVMWSVLSKICVNAWYMDWNKPIHIQLWIKNIHIKVLTAHQRVFTILLLMVSADDSAQIHTRITRTRNQIFYRQPSNREQRHEKWYKERLATHESDISVEEGPAYEKRIINSPSN